MGRPRYIKQIALLLALIVIHLSLLIQAVNIGNGLLSWGKRDRVLVRITIINHPTMYLVQRNSSVKVIVPCILHDHSPPIQSLGLICPAMPAGSSEIDYLEQCKRNVLPS